MAMKAESLTRRRAARTATAAAEVFLLMWRFNFTADMSDGGMKRGSGNNPLQLTASAGRRRIFPSLKVIPPSGKGNVTFNSGSPDPHRSPSAGGVEGRPKQRRSL